VVAVPIAEYLVMAILAAAKGFPELVRAQDRREWLPRPPACGELAGTRALVLGYGSIGRAAADRLRGLEVEVVGVRTRPSEDSVGPDEWRSRLAEFDWVILTLPLTRRTRCVIGKAELASMKSTAWVFNVSRGGLIDPVALEQALRAGTIGGAYLDVTDPEPLPPESPLWTLTNAIITPHSSWATEKMTERAVALFLDNLNRYRSGEPLLNVVDLDAGY
jgi:phosphoglycerate dehydrogenase-like enzyme